MCDLFLLNSLFNCQRPSRPQVQRTSCGQAGRATYSFRLPSSTPFSTFFSSAFRRHSCRLAGGANYVFGLSSSTPFLQLFFSDKQRGQPFNIFEKEQAAVVCPSGFPQRRRGVLGETAWEVKRFFPEKASFKFNILLLQCLFYEKQHSQGPISLRTAQNHHLLILFRIQQ